LRRGQRRRSHRLICPGDQRRSRRPASTLASSASAWLIGASMKATWPAPMNHSDPRLSDTPTRCNASDPDKRDRISSK
jgi:hypothetical protein